MTCCPLTDSLVNFVHPVMNCYPPNHLSSWPAASLHAAILLLQSVDLKNGRLAAVRAMCNCYPVTYRPQPIAGWPDRAQILYGR